ncbi:MAG: alpha-glucosidase [Anaerolineales bacterium]|nr:MAG: alpha-glucosidase [Anaerolineales bacterium]
MDISRIFYVLRALRLSGISRTLQNTIIRDHNERLATNNNSTETSVKPGTLIEYDKIPGGFIFKFENANLEVVFLTEEMIRITWGPGKPSYPYTINRTEWNFVDAELTAGSSDRFTLRGNNLQVMLGEAGNVIFGDRNDKILKQDNAPIRCGETWKVSTNLSPDEHIYGLGERSSSINLRPGRYTSWNTDAGGTYTRGSDPLYIGTPIYLSISPSGSHLVYFENSYRSTFEIGETLEASFSGGELRYYVITGSLSTIYTQLGDLIGRPFLPPKWSLGYHQCRWGYHTEEDIRQVIKGFETHDLPISAIHLDIDYMDGFKVFTVDKSHFPELKNLTTELDHQGIKVVASINPAVKRDAGYDIYAVGLSRDVYCKLPNGKTMNGVSWPGWSVFPDFTNAETRQWWMSLYKRLFDQGISGIWHDMNEPSSFTAWGDKSFPITTRHAMEGCGGDHLEAHNIYGLLMNQSGFEAFRKLTSEKRPWIFSRSGWAGLQKYAWNWTGDVETSWEALQVTIPMLLGLGLSGHIFSGVDIGGFSGNPDAELYQRWFQLGAFLPLFRTHSAVGTEPREPWSFGEPTTSIVRKFAKLRYQLLPYYYTLAWESHQTSLPLLRPLFWNDQENQSSWDIEDEFMLGDALLIAPIVHPGEISRKVVLPAGLWYSYWDDQQHQGPCQVEIHTTPDTIPIFVKGGSVLPTQEGNSLIFHVYPGLDEPSISHIYHDEGDGYGNNRIDKFYLDNQKGRFRIIWDSKGEYRLDYSKISWNFHGVNNDYAQIDGKKIEIVNHELTTQLFNTLELNILRASIHPLDQKSL